MKQKVTKEQIVLACENNISMVKAASDLKIHFNTLKKRALEYNCYKPNPGLKGGNKKVNPKISLVEILEGKHPSFQTYKLKLRLYKEGIFENKCSICGIDSWTNKPLNMELDHINGDRTDHKLDNLRILCPNCHSQTETYRSKNRN